MAIYHQDIADIELNSGSILRTFLKRSIGLADAAANRFGVRVFRDGEPETLSGVTCQGFFKNADGVNIALTSYGTIDGNVAYVTLPAACYNVEGRFTLAIKLVGSDVTGTMRIVDGNVDNTNTSSPVAPTGSVPTYQEVLSVFGQMQDALEDYDETVATQNAQISDLKSAIANNNAQAGLIDILGDSGTDTYRGVTVKKIGEYLEFAGTATGNARFKLNGTMAHAASIQDAWKTERLPVVTGKKYRMIITSILKNGTYGSAAINIIDSSGDSVTAYTVKDGTEIRSEIVAAADNFACIILFVPSGSTVNCKYRISLIDIDYMNTFLNISDCNQGMEENQTAISKINELMPKIKPNSNMIPLLEQGLITSSGDSDNTMAIRSKWGILVPEDETVAISIQHKPDVNQTVTGYVARYDSETGELINRSAISSTNFASDDLGNRMTWFYTEESGAIVRPYFAVGSSDTMDVADYFGLEMHFEKPVKILECGDSICRGYRNGYKGFAGGIGYIYKNIGVGNASIAINASTQVTSIPEAFDDETEFDADVVISDGGINDYHYDSPLGTIPTIPAKNSTEAAALDKTTVAGGLGYLFYQMIDKYPNALKMFVITHKTLWKSGNTYCPATANSAGYTQQELHDAIVAICNLYGVFVIDVYKDSILNTIFSQYVSPTAYGTDSTTANQYLCDNDGVHPTALGYDKCYRPLIKAALERFGL